MTHAQAAADAARSEPKVAGYREQKPETLAVVNAGKVAEELMLRELDTWRNDPDVEQRWLSIARTHFEQGYMALNRALMRPQRLDDDAIANIARALGREIP